MSVRVRRRKCQSSDRTKTDTEQERESIDCAVCRSRLVEPVRLPCDHRFCLVCISGWWRETTVKCPMCRRRCGAWLRRHPNGPPVDEQLRKRVQLREDRSSPPISDEIRFRISAPGEIRCEYEAEIKKIHEERRFEEQKSFKESEKLINDLINQDRMDNEAMAIKLKRDEDYALKLSNDINIVQKATLSNCDRVQRSDKNIPNNKNGKKNFLEMYFRTENKNTCHSKKKDFSNNLSKITPSISYVTLHKNKVDEKIFLSPQLGQKILNNSNMKSELSESHGYKNSANSDSVNQTVDDSRKRFIKNIYNQNASSSLNVIDFEIKSEDSLIQELCYFKPIDPAPSNRSNTEVIKIIPIKPENKHEIKLNERKHDKHKIFDALSQLKNTIKLESSKQSAFVYLTAIPTCIKTNTTNDSSVLKPTKNLKDLEIALQNQEKTHIQPKEFFPNELQINTNSSEYATPKKCAIRNAPIMSKISSSCSKVKKSTTSPEKYIRKLRSMSNGNFDINTHDKTLINNCKINITTKNNIKNLNSNFENSSTLTNNLSSIKSTRKNKYTRISDKMKVTGKNENGEEFALGLLHTGYNSVFQTIHPSIIEEQRKIEEKLKQEKKDFEFAKKLQQKMEYETQVRKYNIRTATKRQATLIEMVTSPKNMKI